MGGQVKGEEGLEGSRVAVDRANPLVGDDPLDQPLQRRKLVQFSVAQQFEMARVVGFRDHFGLVRSAEDRQVEHRARGRAAGQKRNPQVAAAGVTLHGLLAADPGDLRVVAPPRRGSAGADSAGPGWRGCSDDHRTRRLAGCDADGQAARGPSDQLHRRRPKALDRIHAGRHPAPVRRGVQSGNWNSGIVRLDKDLILLTTLKKGSLTTGNHYEGHFIGPDRVQWQSQTQTRRDSLVGRILAGTEPRTRVHLFVRSAKLRNGKAAPFLYCGQPIFAGWEGEKPITVTWRLAQEVPEHMRARLHCGRCDDGQLLDRGSRACAQASSGNGLMT